MVALTWHTCVSGGGGLGGGRGKRERDGGVNPIDVFSCAGRGLDSGPFMALNTGFFMCSERSVMSEGWLSFETKC